MYGKAHPKPCVTATIVNSEKKVLLTLRSPKVLFPGLWCLPGGHLDGGSSWLDALRAEIRDEVGLEVVEATLTGIYSDPKIHYLKEPTSGELHPFVGANFLVGKYRGEVKLNDEASEFGWFSPDEFPAELLECERVKALDGLRYSGVPVLG